MTKDKNEIISTMKTTNYYNVTATFTVGQTITHVTDDGAMVKGIIRALVTPDALDVNFEDGEEGTERATSCF